MSGEDRSDSDWRPWRVQPRSGFKVLDPSGHVGLVQITETDFLVTTRLRFESEEVETDLRRILARAGRTSEEINRMVADAMVLDPSEIPTNLASIPQFMQWFERPYGIHTLAALIHDDLIVDSPNGGALGSDTLADRYFRKMLQACGTPWIKRWIMWGAVALRSRWAAGGRRRLSLLAWIAFAVAGITSFAVAVGWTVATGKVPGWSWVLLGITTALLLVSGVVNLTRPSLSYAIGLLAAASFVVSIAVAVIAGAVPTGAWILTGVAVALPFVTAPLWGEQWGASLVAAPTGIFVIPAAMFAVLGLAIYWMLEETARLAGRV